ncbi:hypothetical protein BDZ97DRAFT_1048445 [Flammula alnicola]|nr:hypothetical protein BDZ97DRAFT_1048445 [Flammula alnicola]
MTNYATSSCKRQAIVNKEDPSQLPDCHSTSSMRPPGQEVCEEASRRENNDTVHVNHLPVEVLCQIFEMAIHRQYYIISHNVLREYLTVRWDPRAAPFNLLHVCRYWRAIAQTTSSLWTSLSGRQDLPHSPRISTMKYCLEQSLSAPLDLFLSHTDHRTTSDPLHANKMLQLFVTEAHRWRSLAIGLNSDLAEDFIALLQEYGADRKFLSLEQLEINAACPETLLRTLMSLIPLLKSLRRLYWNHQAVVHPPLRLPWNQLHFVYIDTPLSPQDTLSYMSQCSCATSITFMDVRKSSGPQGSPLTFKAPIISLSNLKTLRLRGKGNPVSLLPYFFLPNLEGLEIYAVHPPPCQYLALEIFLERSRCPLRRIRVHNHPRVRDEDIIQFFQIPHLAPIPAVEMAGYCVHAQLLEILLEHAGARLIFPRLLAWGGLSREHYVGWKDLGQFEHLEYSYKDGKLRSGLPSIVVP